MLITKTDIATHRQISTTTRDDKINPHIEDAELLIIKGLLGELLYNDIVANPATAENIAILSPKIYIYNGNNYQHHGLKKVLSIFSYASYILAGGFTDTGFGFVEKSTQDSQAVTDANKRNVYKSEQQKAHLYFNEIRLFLDRNVEDYPLWNADCTSRGAGKIRINKITVGNDGPGHTHGDYRGTHYHS